MSDVKWIKIATNIFDNRKIRIIESLPDGYAIIVVWLKILCLAGSINDSGYVYITNGMPYTNQMLATQLNMPIATIQLALQTFEQFHMVEVVDSVLHISNWEKYQNVECMEKIREQNRIRKQNQRSRELSRDCHVTVTQCHAIEEDKERRIKKEEYKERGEKVDCQLIADMYNRICTSFPSVRSLSEARRTAIRARAKQYQLEDFETMFLKAEASSFLKGANNRNWIATFDWMLKDANMAKILDGNYDDKSRTANGTVPKTKTAQELDDFYRMAADWAAEGSS